MCRHRWNSEWALAACEPGVISLLALSDWMFFLTNAVMGMLRDKPSMQIPWSLCLLAMPLVIGHVVQDMLRSMRTRDRHTRNHVGHKMNTLFSCLKRSGKRSNRPSADVELVSILMDSDIPGHDHTRHWLEALFVGLKSRH